MKKKRIVPAALLVPSTKGKNWLCSIESTRAGHVRKNSGTWNPRQLIKKLKIANDKADMMRAGCFSEAEKGIG
jgi:hypothetical protein